MTMEEKLAACITERGLRIKFVAEKAGVPYSCLQPSLHGDRKIKANELLAVCAALDVNPADFRSDAV